MARKRRAPRAARAERNLTGVENCQRAIRLDLSSLGRFLCRVNREVGLSGESVFVRFVTDREMARLNRKFRKKAKTTDVLSFPSTERSRPVGFHARAGSLRGEFLGDIAIAPNVARHNAKSFNRSLSEEICILMLHGVLHLLGYDHESDRGEMEREEARLRRRLGLNP